MSKKLTIDFIKKRFEKENYILLTKNYKNVRQKLEYICPRGHRYNISWASWNRGSRCLLCENDNKRRIAKNKKLIKYQAIKKEFEKEGYTLLSTSYVCKDSPLDYICPKNNKHKISWSNWRKGQRCPCCVVRTRTPYNFIKEAFESEGYKLLSTKYTHSKQKLNYICPKGHEHSITWSNWKSGQRCVYCAGNIKKNIDVIKNNVESNDYTVLSSLYFNARTPLHLLCPNGHDYYVTWDNWNSKENRCPRCTNNGTSKQEVELIDFIKSIYNKKIISRTKSIIPPLELDIVLPDIGLAIEYCGLYWHSELVRKDRKYHLNKLEQCNFKNYKLITIFEDEFLLKRDILESVLINKIGLNSNKHIYARKCIVKEISTAEARNFCECNHLQGYAGSSVKLGLFYDKELVYVMTFSKQSVAKGSKHRNNYWELSRFCSKINYSVVGGASKLLKYFEKHYFWIKIVSYADRRWSDGNVYYKLGFTFDKFTKPNCWYFKNHEINRVRKFVFCKDFDKYENVTEWKLKQKESYNRIWDCGNYKFVKSKTFK